MAISKAGELFFTDKQSVYRVDGQGTTSLFAKLKGYVGGISFHEDGKLYAGDLTRNRIVAIDEHGKWNDVVSNVQADYITISSKGIYFTEPGKDRVGFFSFSKRNNSFVAMPGHPTGIAITAEQTFLNVGVTNSTFGFSLQIAEDGHLDFPQEYIHYHIPYGKAFPDATGMTVDAGNLLYTSTAIGIQVSDQLGRINFIFSKPEDHTVDVKLGGSDFDTLYVSSNGKLYHRKINAKGILSWLPAVKPPRPGL
jgi:gluconolactonase